MKLKYLTLLGLFFPLAAFPLDGIYLGGQVGHVGLTAATGFNNAIGYGVDLGFRSNPVLDLVLRSHYSSHGGGAGMTLWSNTVSADFMVSNFNDIEFFLGGGAGFYLFSGGASRFGLHADAFGDLAVTDGLRVGLGFRYHGIFNPAATESSYWTAMLRVGYFFL